jgi:Uma2 family endonuclease
MRLAARRYRVADVAVFEGQEPSEEFPSSPPLIVIEIVSPDDRHTEIVEKLDEYKRWGVPNVWLVDPHSRRLYVYGDSGLAEVKAYELPQYELRLSRDDLV